MFEILGNSQSRSVLQARIAIRFVGGWSLCRHAEVLAGPGAEVDLLAPLAAEWAVHVGGFGLLPGSLANLIALRMAADRRIWWRFHLYSIPMLLWAAAVGYGLLLLLR